MNSVAQGPSKADSSTAAAKQIPCLFETHASLPCSKQTATSSYTCPRTRRLFFQEASSVPVFLHSSWNVMAHGDAREKKWRGNWRMEWVASTLHTTLEHGVSSITTADVHTSAASSRVNWRHRRFKWTRPFRRKTKSGFCACVITFQTQSTIILYGLHFPFRPCPKSKVARFFDSVTCSKHNFAI